MEGMEGKGKFNKEVVVKSLERLIVTTPNLHVFFTREDPEFQGLYYKALENLKRLERRDIYPSLCTLSDSALYGLLYNQGANDQIIYDLCMYIIAKRRGGLQYENIKTKNAFKE